MENKEKVLPTHKWIIINDLNRELAPIGYGFQSPIYRPSKFPVDIIGQLLNVSKVTAMFEVYPSDHTLKVRLDNSNFRKPFEEIWAEQFPDIPFPWSNEITTVDVQAQQPPATEQNPVTDPDLGNQQLSEGGDQTPQTPEVPDGEPQGDAGSSEQTETTESNDETPQTPEVPDGEPQGNADGDSSDLEDDEEEEDDDLTGNDAASQTGDITTPKPRKQKRRR